MKQLLEITNVPASFELKIHRAKLELSSALQDEQNLGHYNFSNTHKPSKRIHNDTYEARSRVMHKHDASSISTSLQNSIFKPLSTTTSMKKGGNLLMEKAFDNDTSGNIDFHHTHSNSETQTEIFSNGANGDYQQIFVQNQIDALSFEWRTQNKPQLNFTPGSIEYVVKEYAHLEIKYMGKPLYVPPSSSPDYDPKFDTTV